MCSGSNVRSAISRLIAGLALVLFALPVLAEDMKRVALVFGNSDYQFVSRLTNPANDAHDIGTALKRLGFSVTTGVDLDYNQMRLAVRDFAEASSDADIVMIYFAGHGIEIDNTNYLIPVNAQLKSDRDVDFEAIRLDMIVDAIADAPGLKIVLVDACRNNPFLVEMERTSATRSIGRGLARVDPSGVLVGYSARGGTLALDGDGRNSPYAQAILQHIEEPGLEIGKLFRKVRDTVFEMTDGAQEPFTYGSLPGEDIYLVAAAPAPVPVAEPIAPPGLMSQQDRLCAQAMVAWSLVFDSDDKSMIERFVEKHSDCSSAVDVAKARIAMLDAAEPEAQEQPAPKETMEVMAEQDVAAEATGATVQIADVTTETDWVMRCKFLADVERLSIETVENYIDAAFTACTLAHKQAPDDARTTAALARIYDIREEYDISFKYWSIAGEKGYPPAMAALGEKFESGVGTNVDLVKASGWYRRAVEAGSVSGMAQGLDVPYGTNWEKCKLYADFEAGGEPIRADVVALEACTRAFEQNPNEVRAAAALGRIYSVREEPEKSFFYLGRAAEGGYPPAMVELGEKFESGVGTNVDLVKASGWYRRAAEAGSVSGMAQLGSALTEGFTGRVDSKQALMWYKRAASTPERAHESGWQAWAMYQVGAMYADGRGVGKNSTEAFGWYLRSAEQGQRCAMDSVGVAYENGDGVEKNLTLAKKWYVKAAEAGCPYGMGHFAVLLASQNDPDVSLVRNWMLTCLESDLGCADRLNMDFREVPRVYISALQEALQMRGHYKGKIDGAPGPATLAAMRAVFKG